MDCVRIRENLILKFDWLDGGDLDGEKGKGTKEDGVGADCSQIKACRRPRRSKTTFAESMLNRDCLRK